MSKEHELLMKICGFIDNDVEGFVSDIKYLLAQPNEENLTQQRQRLEGYVKDSWLTNTNPQEPVAWMLIDKETGSRIPRAYKPENINEDRWELYPLYISPPKNEKFDINKVLDL